MKPRWRVVLVDDHAPSLASVVEAVTEQGGTVMATGRRMQDAQVLLDTYRPDVAIFAVGLAEGDGIEAARASVCRCPVVLLTSHTDPEISGRAMEAGVLGFLAKPLRPEELGPALDVAVSRFHDLEAARQENETLRRQLESRKLVDRAKAALIRRLGLSEPEAYRRIQKAAMDARKPMAEVARTLLVTEERGSLQSSGCPFLRQPRDGCLLNRQAAPLRAPWNLPN
jgi:two-component system, response regulator PdtaR